jgi:HEAT repeat protein
LLEAIKRKQGSFIVDIRIQAARRLADCGAIEALPALEKMSKDKDPEAHKVAVEAIAKIKAVAR